LPSRDDASVEIGGEARGAVVLEEAMNLRASVTRDVDRGGRDAAGAVSMRG
jgi:hypothetical protein